MFHNTSTSGLGTSGPGTSGPGFRFNSLRYLLLTLVIVPLLLLSGTVILLASNWSFDYTYEQLFTKVNTDLRVARDGFTSIQVNGQRELYWLANSTALTGSLKNSRHSQLQALLEERRLHGGFDFLKLLNTEGDRILLGNGWQPHKLRASPLTQKALAAPVVELPGDVVSGIEIYSSEQWQNEPHVEANEVRFSLIDTARAVPTQRAIEDRAMIIRTLLPVQDSSGARIALLEGGLLLNRNFQFVDRIRDLVYGPGSLAPGSRGTVTVFLDDVRITTNVPSNDDSRALGTRVSREVHDAVLINGESWVNRAFVVNDWYISAYEPIVDVYEKRVGMLYAGYLEAPFRAELVKAIAALSALVLAGSLLAAFAAILGARSVFAPIESMTSVVRAIARGEHRRIGPIATGNEIGELAFQFDDMLDTLEEHRERIVRDASLLEQKVHDRTRALEKQNFQLQDSIDLLHRTRQQLATAEKLAALGELTAGVAHEINNPTAVILGNMDVLSTELGHGCDVVQTEIDLIIEQVYRIRSITDKLLQYSRSVEHNEGEAGTNRPVDPMQSCSAEPDRAAGPLLAISSKSTALVSIEELVGSTLKLLSHEFSGHQIKVCQKHDCRLDARIERQEFQQVFVNLISNAIASVNGTGQIDIESTDSDTEFVRIAIKDDGCGIEKHNLPRIFDPFFTTGKDQGTGLGLSVSYGIVRRFGGDIQVTSELGAGSEFVVILPGAFPV